MSINEILAELDAVWACLATEDPDEQIEPTDGVIVPARLIKSVREQLRQVQNDRRAVKDDANVMVTFVFGTSHPDPEQQVARIERELGFTIGSDRIKAMSWKVIS